MPAASVVSIILVALVGAGLFILFGMSPMPATTPYTLSLPEEQTDSPRGTPYHEIERPAGFVNTGGKPVTIGEYIGKKVVLLDIMTYSCINCQRTFPYVEAWYEKYKDDGFVVIGIHTPEFAFEKNLTNVAEAMKRFNITFPVVLDNDYGTWNAYGNQYWPRKYLIDIHGNIVYDHIGEGGYEETEMKIRELLTERAKVLGTADTVNESLAADAIPATTSAAGSPETYFGAARNTYLANGTPGRTGAQTFALPKTFSANALYLDGLWNVSDQYAESSGISSVVYKYNAKEVYIVADADTISPLEVLQDGKPVGAASGDDVTKGVANIKESRLYKLIRNPEPGLHTLELRIKNSGIRFYAFTFG